MICFLKSLMSSGFTSGTIKGTFLSILKSEVLSITTAPDLVALGMNFFETSDPGEDKTMSILLKSNFGESLQ